ncbi:hypothetical protein NQ317_012315 [Molorchus minor]|uniref:Uncharacterized protein n=1 Tax=Molorchus minor TaxID=1323400 RepID=A0ABQ9J3S0_9CUCU|nr:hypothetical protein NQ317_012315 [Molorchus minor]
MDTKAGDGTRERSRRPVRNKRYNRRPYGEEKRPPKRLFTPEIKRFLKDWLTTNKYKNHIMEKYLKDCQKPEYNTLEIAEESKPSMISKWLESAANFKPSESSYLDWTFSKMAKEV